MRSSLPVYVKLWFAADLFLALFPPLHWAARGPDPIIRRAGGAALYLRHQRLYRAERCRGLSRRSTAFAGRQGALSMDLLITYGALAVFFAIVIAILQYSYVADRDFSDFTVAGRSFGGFYQAMAFLNTGLPGFMFLGSFGFIVRAGVLGIGISTLLATIVMYLMADRVWTWGAKIRSPHAARPHGAALRQPGRTRHRCAARHLRPDAMDGAWHAGARGSLLRALARSICRLRLPWCWAWSSWLSGKSGPSAWGCAGSSSPISSRGSSLISWEAR